MSSADALVDVVRRIAAGEQEAVSVLYDATSARVFGLALRILGDVGLAEEAALDVYTQVWQKAKTYDVSRGSPVGWLLVLTRSRALDRLRSAKRHKGEVLEEVKGLRAPGPTPEETTQASQNAERIRHALGELPTEQREAIEEAFFGGLTHTEIARKLDQPLGTIKSRIRAGLTALSKILTISNEKTGYEARTTG